MEQTKEIVLKLKFTAKHLFLLIALALFAWRPGVLNSAQSMTMTSYYPAPYGGYNKLLTTGATYIADESQDVSFGRHNSDLDFCIGGPNYGEDFYCGEKGRNVSTNSYFYVFGYTHLGKPKDDPYVNGNANIDSTSNVGSTKIYGETDISYLTAKAYVGRNLPSAKRTESARGLFSYVPIATNKWIYVGTDGESTHYHTPRQRYSSNTNTSGAGILIDTSNSDSSGGLILMSNARSGYITHTGAHLRLGGADSSSGVVIVSGGRQVIYIDTSNPTNTTVNGKLIVKKDIMLSSDSTSDHKQTVSKIYNLCYQIEYGRGAQISNRIAKTGCSTGYNAIGFIPLNGGEHVYNAIAYNTGTYSGNPMVYTQDTRDMVRGWLTCCAIDLTVQAPYLQ